MGGVTARQVLAGDIQAAVTRGARRVYHRVMVIEQFIERDIAPDFDIEKESESIAVGDSVENSLYTLGVPVVRRDTEPNQTAREWQALDHGDLDRDIALGEKCLGC